jgi:hypothetical protein
MATYESGTVGAAAATTNNAIVVLWNTGSDRLRLREVAIVNVGSTNAEKAALATITARGTNTGTLAGSALDENDPAAAGTVDFSWSVQPTVGQILRRTHGIVNAMTSVVFSFWGRKQGVWVAGGAGVAMVNQLTSAADAWEAWWVWEE